MAQSPRDSRSDPALTGRRLRVAVFAPDAKTGARMADALDATGHEVIVRTGDETELRSACAAQDPDAVAVGTNAPGKALLRLCRRLRRRGIVVVARSTAGVSIPALLTAGVDGFVLDEGLKETLPLAVTSVCAGQRSFPAAVAPRREGPFLSSREKQVLAMVVMGMTNADIAQKLWLAEATVKSHLGSIFRKLGVRSRNEAAAVVLDPTSGLGTGILTIPRPSDPGTSGPTAPRFSPPAEEAPRVQEPIPLTRMDHADPELFQELLDAVGRVAAKGAFTLGREVEGFEQELADYCGVDHAIGVASGTEALALALRALRVGPGDEVIVPANSFIATAEAVTLVGATPRLVDVDPDHGTMTAASVERNVRRNTRCVIAVHLYGRTVELQPIMTLAQEHGLSVIEDACQAHGARYRGRRVGTIADCGCFSFYPAKNLGGWGDGGAVVTGRRELADRIRLLRSHGEEPRHRHQLCGTTGRLDAIQAAVLRIKLRRLDGWNGARRRLAADLTRSLDGSAVRPPAPVTAGHDHVYHQYVVTCRRRDALRRHLSERGIASAIHYPIPIHLSDAYASLGMGPRTLPIVERLAGQILSLPIFPGMSSQALERISEAVHDFEARDPDPLISAAAVP